MSVVYERRPAPQSGQTCDPLPVCPTCGGLECLCRPRFFAGQLLTDEDLNRLDTYIRGKNRLHNRMLHGWGTVNGLEVRCTPCEDTVTVGAGFALSPCGEDIVLCHDTEVPVCDLINACREREEDDCLPYGKRGDRCRDAEQEWVLAICYDETPTRGVASLRGASAAPVCNRCGGETTSSSGGCSCGVKSDRRSLTGNGRASRTALAQCEPTAICEGHRFRVYPAPRKAQFTPRDKRALETRYGTLPTRYRECVTAIPEVTLDPLSNDANLEERTAAYRRLCEVKNGLRDFLRTEGGTSCELAYTLASIPIPSPNDDAFAAVYADARRQLDDVREELRRYCVCSLLLPPAPEPVHDDCVPLATITVRGDDCTIVDICNFGVRQIALSVPAFQYWLSLTPIGRLLNAYLAALCCGGRFDVRESSRFLNAAMTGLGRRVADTQRPTATPREYFSTARSGQPEPAVDLSWRRSAEIERDDLWRESSFEDIVGPLAEAFVRGPVEPEVEGEEVVPSEPGAMRDELSRLRQVVERQQARIDDLIERLEPS